MKRSGFLCSEDNNDIVIARERSDRGNPHVITIGCKRKGIPTSGKGSLREGTFALLGMTHILYER